MDYFAQVVIGQLGLLKIHLNERKLLQNIYEKVSMIKISISGDSSNEVKDKIHVAILGALGQLTDLEGESFTINIRKERAENRKKLKGTNNE